MGIGNIRYEPLLQVNDITTNIIIIILLLFTVKYIYIVNKN